MKYYRQLLAYAGLLVESGGVRAQFPPTPEGVTVLKSRFNENITISYKEPGLCETTEGVRSYAGYIHLPPGTPSDLGQEQNYPINTFFWFFEARNDPENAPLSIWLNGGPDTPLEHCSKPLGIAIREPRIASRPFQILTFGTGASSMLGLLVENGPCFVNADSNSTRLNPNSWNNNVNIIYIDQPVQVGFSYDTLANFTLDLISGKKVQLKSNDSIPDQDAVFLVGTYASGNQNTTSQGTRNAAMALWHFAQVWFQEFPRYHPNESRISLSTQSYGGRYGPAFTAFFEEQDEKILSGTWNIPGEQYVMHMDTLLLVNACIDRQIQLLSYPHMAYNNTYGIQAVNKSIYNQILDTYYRAGGCRDQINDCRPVSSVYDPDNLGINATVNQACEEADTFCSKNIRAIYNDVSGRNFYDVTQLDLSPFPYNFFIGWLNQPHVQAALGAPLNFSDFSDTSSDAIRSIGDYPRPGGLEDLADLLDRGVKVALMHGDRDYACNWIGGEAASLAINHSLAADFHAAGYESIRTNSTYVGGLVRQHGNLSFSRVFQAGHEAPSWQPETGLAIFTRALGNLDIATGTKDDDSVGVGGDYYSSTGPADTWATRSEVPSQVLLFCYLLAADTCTQEQLAAVQNGSAKVVRYIVEDANSTKLFPGLFAPPEARNLGLGGNTLKGSGDGVSRFKSQF